MKPPPPTPRAQHLTRSNPASMIRQTLTWQNPIGCVEHPQIGGAGFILLYQIRLYT